MITAGASVEKTVRWQTVKHRDKKCKREKKTLANNSTQKQTLTKTDKLAGKHWIHNYIKWPSSDLVLHLPKVTRDRAAFV